MKKGFLQMMAVEAFLLSEDMRLQKSDTYADFSEPIPITNPYAEIDKPREVQSKKPHRHQYIEHIDKTENITKVSWVCKCGRNMYD
jgi:hypothetical protein